MDHFNALGLKKFGDWNEISVGRNENGDVVIVRSGEANHIRGYPSIDALFLCSTHIATTLGACANDLIASGAFGSAGLLLTFYDRNGNARERV